MKRLRWHISDTLVFVLFFCLVAAIPVSYYLERKHENNPTNPLSKAFAELTIGMGKQAAIEKVDWHCNIDTVVPPVILLNEEDEIWDWMWMDDKKPPREEFAETARLFLHFSKDNKLIKVIYKGENIERMLE